MFLVDLVDLEVVIIRKLGIAVAGMGAGRPLWPVQLHLGKIPYDHTKPRHLGMCFSFLASTRMRETCFFSERLLGIRLALIRSMKALRSSSYQGDFDGILITLASFRATIGLLNFKERKLLIDIFILVLGFPYIARPRN